jgi:hypothetical protein
MLRIGQIDFESLVVGPTIEDQRAIVRQQRDCEGKFAELGELFLRRRGIGRARIDA